MKKFAIWTPETLYGADFTGYEADTVIEAMTIIDEVIWWTGRLDIVDNASGAVVMTAIKTDASKGLKALQEMVNSLEDEE